MRRRDWRAERRPPLFREEARNYRFALFGAPPSEKTEGELAL